MPSSMLFAVNNEGRIFGLSTNGTKWREFQYLGLEFKQLSAVPHFLWAVGSDRQIYVHAHGLDIPIRIKEEAYENQRWIPIDGFGKHMLPTDRYRWSSKDGLTERRLDKIRLPSMAWQWEGDWHIETTLEGQPLDDDGWTYAIDFPATYSSQKQWNSCVRRRKWVRYRRYAAINAWCAIAPLHKDPTQEPFIDVSIGGQNVLGTSTETMQVWAVTAHGRVMRRCGVSITAPEGTRWSSISMPSGCEVRSVSCGATGLTWAVLWNGKALVRVGVCGSNPTGEYWLEVAAPEDNLKIIQVSVGTNSVWAVSDDHRVWFRKGVRGGNGEETVTSDELARGSGWVEMVGSMAMVSLAPNDQVFAVGNEDRLVYFRAGVSSTELTGRRWRPLNALTRLSRANSNASLWSYRNSLRSMKHRSTSSLNNVQNRNSSSEASDIVEETSRSAPTSLRLQSSIWRKSADSSNTVNSRTSSESGSFEQPIIENSQSEVDLSKRSIAAWSPVRSVGSLLGMEADPNTDPDSVLDPDMERAVFRERDDIDPAEAVWEQADTIWICVESGAVSLDPSLLPNWFSDGVPSGQFESAPWRSKILSDLKKIHASEISGCEKYEVAVEMASWTKSGECRCCLNGSSNYEDSLLELEWFGNQSGSLDSGTLSVLSIDKTHVRKQLSLGEITSVIGCSEPGCPKLGIHTVQTTLTKLPPLRLLFSGDTDLDDWMANITSDKTVCAVCCQMNGLEGKPGENSIWATTCLGDVYSFDPVNFKTSQHREANLFCKDIDLKEGKECVLTNGFGPGSRLTVTGSVPDGAERFALNLHSQWGQSKGDKGIAFHFNPRFSDGIIVRNSKTNDIWGVEEREGGLPITPGSDFSVNILCQEDGFKVLVNGIILTFYEHRHKPHGISHISISGSLQVHRAVYYSTTVIVPLAEMFWRQMGGHLQTVETCSVGVTWGIGADNTPWVYTGGWGGSALGGLERTVVGIHPMTDTHCCYVYENQRWNPLSGFTSKGLPTDRPMWSDSTGKVKRSKETTRLLSMHWQWVGDWMVDYHTPGGVDKDGWQYAVDFPRNYHARKTLTDYVRRRRWVRKCKLTTSGPWQEVGNTKLCNISLQSLPGSTEVSLWAVGANGDALYRKGVRHENPLGDTWEHVSCDQTLCSISCGFGNQVWAVARNGSTYWRFGITSSNPMGEVWESVEPPSGVTIKQVSVGKWSIWVVDSDGKVFVRKEVTSVFPEGTHWQSVTDNLSDGGFRHISTGHSEVWAISNAGIICRRIGITAENPAGILWETGLPGNWQHISARGYT